MGAENARNVRGIPIQCAEEARRLLHYEQSARLFQQFSLVGTLIYYTVEKTVLNLID